MAFIPPVIVPLTADEQAAREETIIDELALGLVRLKVTHNTTVTQVVNWLHLLKTTLTPLLPSLWRLPPTWQQLQKHVRAVVPSSHDNHMVIIDTCHDGCGYLYRHNVYDDYVQATPSEREHARTGTSAASASHNGSGGSDSGHDHHRTRPRPAEHKSSAAAGGVPSLSSSSSYASSQQQSRAPSSAANHDNNVSPHMRTSCPRCHTQRYYYKNGRPYARWQMIWFPIIPRIIELFGCSSWVHAIRHPERVMAASTANNDNGHYRDIYDGMIWQQFRQSFPADYNTLSDVPLPHPSPSPGDVDDTHTSSISSKPKPGRGGHRVKRSAQPTSAGATATSTAAAGARVAHDNIPLHDIDIDDAPHTPPSVKPSMKPPKKYTHYDGITYGLAFSLCADGFQLDKMKRKTGITAGTGLLFNHAPWLRSLINNMMVYFIMPLGTKNVHHYMVPFLLEMQYLSEHGIIVHDSLSSLYHGRPIYALVKGTLIMDQNDLAAAHRFHGGPSHGAHHGACHHCDITGIRVPGNGKSGRSVWPGSIGFLPLNHSLRTDWARTFHPSLSYMLSNGKEPPPPSSPSSNEDKQKKKPRAPRIYYYNNGVDMLIKMNEQPTAADGDDDHAYDDEHHTTANQLSSVAAAPSSSSSREEAKEGKDKAGGDDDNDICDDDTNELNDDHGHESDSSSIEANDLINDDSEHDTSCSDDDDDDEKGKNDDIDEKLKEVQPVNKNKTSPVRILPKITIRSFLPTYNTIHQHVRDPMHMRANIGKNIISLLKHRAATSTMVWERRRRTKAGFCRIETTIINGEVIDIVTYDAQQKVAKLQRHRERAEAARRNKKKKDTAAAKTKAKAKNKAPSSTSSSANRAKKGVSHIPTAKPVRIKQSIYLSQQIRDEWDMISSRVRLPTKGGGNLKALFAHTAWAKAKDWHTFTGDIGIYLFLDATPDALPADVINCICQFFSWIQRVHAKVIPKRSSGSVTPSSSSGGRAGVRICAAAADHDDDGKRNGSGRDIPDDDNDDYLAKLEREGDEILTRLEMNMPVQWNLISKHYAHHWCSMIRMFGPLWTTSMWSIERLNGAMMRTLHGYKSPIRELANQLMLRERVTVHQWQQMQPPPPSPSPPVAAEHKNDHRNGARGNGNSSTCSLGDNDDGNDDMDDDPSLEHVRRLPSYHPPSWYTGQYSYQLRGARHGRTYSFSANDGHYNAMYRFIRDLIIIPSSRPAAGSSISSHACAPQSLHVLRDDNGRTYGGSSSSLSSSLAGDSGAAVGVSRVRHTNTHTYTDAFNRLYAIYHSKHEAHDRNKEKKESFQSFPTWLNTLIVDHNRNREEVARVEMMRHGYLLDHPIDTIREDGDMMNILRVFIDHPLATSARSYTAFTIGGMYTSYTSIHTISHHMHHVYISHLYMMYVCICVIDDK
jgi:hypothetical protein